MVGRLTPAASAIRSMDVPRYPRSLSNLRVASKTAVSTVGSGNGPRRCYASERATEPPQDRLRYQCVTASDPQPAVSVALAAQRETSVAGLFDQPVDQQ